jgi:geranylgeranyl diphosphate synthase, type I
MMDLAWANSTYLPWIEDEMRAVVCSGDAQASGHYGMMQYHMGWVDESFGPISAPSGKRIRPLLCLLACGAAGGDPRMALPAAAGLELLHNFSLIHDDIEDHSPTRRQRPTVWRLFGMPQACNAGDGMFSLAHLAFHRLRDFGAQERIVLETLRLFDETCLSLTEGQYLDMAFENRVDVTVGEYFRMTAGKTGALLAASTQIGAVVAGAPADQVRQYHAFGAAMGRAFQLQDDILGIWGDEAITGKSAAGDILSKKKTLPIILALAHPTTGPRMSELYAGPPFEEADVPAILSLLEASGAQSYVEEQIRASICDAQSALSSLQPHAERVFLTILAELLESLVERVS